MYPHLSSRYCRICGSHIQHGRIYGSKTLSGYEIGPLCAQCIVDGEKAYWFRSPKFFVFLRWVIKQLPLGNAKDIQHLLWNKFHIPAYIRNILKPAFNVTGVAFQKSMDSVCQICGKHVFTNHKRGLIDGHTCIVCYSCYKKKIKKKRG